MSQQRIAPALMMWAHHHDDLLEPFKGLGRTLWPACLQRRSDSSILLAHKKLQLLAKIRLPGFGARMAPPSHIVHFEFFMLLCSK
jgi:hypothetical protein